MWRRKALQRVNTTQTHTYMLCIYAYVDLNKYKTYLSVFAVKHNSNISRIHALKSPHVLLQLAFFGWYTMVYDCAFFFLSATNSAEDINKHLFWLSSNTCTAAAPRTCVFVHNNKIEIYDFHFQWQYIAETNKSKVFSLKKKKKTHNI